MGSIGLAPCLLQNSILPPGRLTLNYFPKDLKMGLGDSTKHKAWERYTGLRLSPKLKLQREEPQATNYLLKNATSSGWKDGLAFKSTFSALLWDSNSVPSTRIGCLLTTSCNAISRGSNAIFFLFFLSFFWIPGTKLRARDAFACRNVSAAPEFYPVSLNAHFLPQQGQVLVSAGRWNNLFF